jgi:peptidoglycan/xylan/chitin deacetylase (PgdA/CDA1 family)
MPKSLALNSLKPLATIGSGLGKQKKLLVLIYHRVLDRPDPMRPEEIDIKTFKWQMELLKAYFNVLPLDIALEQLKNDCLPSRAVCITFDDGYADNYHNALPVLSEMEFNATFFIASGYLDGGRMWNDTIIESIRLLTHPTLDLKQFGCDLYDVSSDIKKAQTSLVLLDKVKRMNKEQQTSCINAILSHIDKDQIPKDLMLSTEQLKALSKAGMIIGGHTVTHPILSSMSDEEVDLELTVNKASLEELIDKPVDFFAYPNGKLNMDYRLDQTKIIEKAGYKAAFSTNWSYINKKSDIWQLPRFRPWENNPVDFMIRLVYMYFK